jgi:uncharacterized membrane protein
MSWYYAQADEPKGPIPEAEFLQLIAQGIIQPSTLVWKEGMDRWVPWADLRSGLIPGTLTPASPSVDSIPAAGMPTSEAPPQAGLNNCVACLKPFPEEDLIVLAGRKVCAACKPAYVQSLQEGAVGWSPPPVGSGAEGSAHGNLDDEHVLARDYDIPVVDLVMGAARRVQQDPGTLLVAGILTMVALWGAQLVTFPFQLIPFIGVFIGMIIVTLLTGPVLAGLILTYLRHLRGMQVSAGDVFCGFGPRFIKLALAHAIPALIGLLAFFPALLVGIFFAVDSFKGMTPGTMPNLSTPLAVGLGATALIGWLTNIYLSISWVYTLPLVADRNYGVLEAMKLSRAMVSKHFWQHLWFMIFAGLVMMLGFFACCVGIFVATPILALAGTMLYERLFHGLRPRSPQ